jgi:hypothetical protein
MQNNSFKENPTNLLEEYQRLSQLSPMTSSDIERLTEILELAESNEFLSDLLDEVDEQLFNSSILSESESSENSKYYKEQQKKTIECLDAIDKKNDLILVQRQLLSLINGE